MTRGANRGWFQGALAAIAVLGAVQAVFAQGPPPPPVANGADASALSALVPAIPGTLTADLVEPAAPANFLLGDEDLLAIFVFEMPEYTRQARIESDGMLRLSYLNAAIPAAGETAPQVAAQVAAALQSAGLARSPMVQVTVRQVVSRTVVVTGAVKYPITLQAVRPLPLLEAVARAGGASDAAGEDIVITRPSADGTVQTTELSLTDAMLPTHAATNPVLLGGETVRLLPAKMVYAVGALNKPGAYPLQAGQPITVLRVLALAEGVKDPADSSHGVILRPAANGAQQEIPVDVNKLLRRQAADIPLQAGDVFYLPVNGKRKGLDVGVQTLSQAAAIALGYAFVR